MQILRSLDELANSTKPSVVSVGNFDGVHLGHQVVLKSMVDRARGSGAQSAVVTFDPHPSHVLHSSRRTPLITPLPQKLDLLAATGIDLALVLEFNEELRRWSAREFAKFGSSSPSGGLWRFTGSRRGVTGLPASVR